MINGRETQWLFTMIRGNVANKGLGVDNGEWYMGTVSSFVQMWVYNDSGKGSMIDDWYWLRIDKGEYGLIVIDCRWWWFRMGWERPMITIIENVKQIMVVNRELMNNDTCLLWDPQNQWWPMLHSSKPLELDTEVPYCGHSRPWRPSGTQLLGGSILVAGAVPILQLFSGESLLSTLKEMHVLVTGGFFKFGTQEIDVLLVKHS